YYKPDAEKAPAAMRPGPPLTAVLDSMCVRPPRGGPADGGAPLVVHPSRRSTGARPGLAACWICRAGRASPGTPRKGAAVAPSLVHRLGAEFLGTFWLVFGGCGSAIFAAQ